MPHRVGVLVGICCAAAMVAGPAGAPAAGAPSAAAARTCRPPDYPGSGYFTSLSVTKVGCRRGSAVTLAHYRCRTRTGPAGRCGRSVLGYRCAERRQSIPTEIDGRVTCRSGARRVTYTYQQNR